MISKRGSGTVYITVHHSLVPQYDMSFDSALQRMDRCVEQFAQHQDQ
ncbi:hypothetical protein LBMAG21_06740 [Armatimonadota bacterium]|nr:hypothetical protein LBMAG21_06740 [Armatimonadota bacterium]